MFESFSSANKYTIETQIDYFERALKESGKTSDTYYADRSQALPGSQETGNSAISRPSEESISKAKEWIALQRKDYADSAEILALCNRWEALFAKYREKMEAERSSIQARARDDVNAARKAWNNPDAVPTQPSASTKTSKKRAESTDAPAFERDFNAKHLKAFESRIAKVSETLARLDTPDGARGVSKVSELRAVASALEAVRNNGDTVQVSVLQKAIRDVLPEAKFTQSKNQGEPDGLFGDITMGHLEKLAGISAPASAPAAAEGDAAAPSKKPVSNPSATPESGEASSMGREFAFSKGGKFYLLGKNGAPELVRVETFPKELVGHLEKMESVGRKFEDLFFLLSAYAAKYPDGKFEARSKEIAEALAKIDPSDVAATEKLLSHYVDIVTTDPENAKKVKEIFSASSDKERKAKLFAFVRNELGQYDVVSAAIAERGMAEHDIGPAEMAELTKIVRQFPESPEKALQALRATNGALADRLRNNAGYGTDEKAYLALFRRLASAYSDAKGHLRKIDAQISEQLSETLKKAGREKDFDKEKAALESRVLEQFLSAAAAREILTTSIAKRGEQGNAEYALFAKIEGIGALRFSDRTTDIGKEIGILVATELAAFAAGALTMGVGAWAINAAVYGSRGIRLAERAGWIGRMAHSTGNIATGARFLGGTAVEGALFYEGSNLVQNVFEKRDWFEGAGDKKEILKSMLFVGALKGFAKLSAKIPGLAAAETDGAAKFVLKGTARIALEGLALGATAGGIEIAFEGGEWTREQFIEGIMMALVLRAMGKAKDKMFFKPNGNGGVSVSEPAPSRTTAEARPASSAAAESRPSAAAERPTQAAAERPGRAVSEAQVADSIAPAFERAKSGFNLSSIVPEKIRKATMDKFHHLQESFVASAKAKPGQALDLLRAVVTGNSHHHPTLNNFLLSGLGKKAGGHGHGEAHGSSAPFWIGQTLAFGINQGNKINDAGGMSNYLNHTLGSWEGATSEAADVMATFLFARWLGWGRTILGNTIAERTVGDNNWSTTASSGGIEWFNDWAFGPDSTRVVPPKK